MSEETAPSTVLPQAEVQSRVEAVVAARGFEAGCEWLFDYAHAVGYLETWLYEANERHSFRDAATGVTFCLQINRTRARYNPTAAQQVDAAGRPLPPLHCPLCFDNIGRPGKEKLRVYEFPLGASRRPFFIQLTPFPLRPYHYILIHRDRIPMDVGRELLRDLFDFLALAPSFTVCSNSDVEWAGASILNHLHYQVFRDYHLPIMEARPARGCERAIGGVEVAMLDYPCPVVRLAAPDAELVLELGDRAIRAWRERDPGRNTFNIVLYREEAAGGGRVVLNLIYRNPDHRTPPELTEIKSEGVGVIEMAGEGIYPEPQGERRDAIYQRLRKDGLAVITGIMSGNGPFGREEYAARFEWAIAGLR